MANKRQRRATTRNNVARTVDHIEKSTGSECVVDEMIATGDENNDATQEVSDDDPITTNNRPTRHGSSSIAHRTGEVVQHRRAEDNATIRSHERVVPENVRLRQRAVAQREAARLARPDQRPVRTLAHADRKKSAVNSTPFGIFEGTSKVGHGERTIDGIDTSEWCGPFSLARQMIAKREELKRQRELEENNDENHPLDEMMVQVEKEINAKLRPSLQWKGRTNMKDEYEQKGSMYTKRQKRVELKTAGRSKVPSLFTLCVNYLVDNFEHVECLGTTIDNSIRTTIAKELVANGKLNGETFPALAEVGIDALEIVDCADITQKDLSDRMKVLIPAGLKYLILDQAGRCVGPKSIETIIECLETNGSTGTNNTIEETMPSVFLQAISIGGAYLLTDVDTSRLIKASSKKGLSSLEFKACPLLGPLMLNTIRDCFKSSTMMMQENQTNNACLLDLSLEDLTWLESNQLEALVSDPSALRNLRGLSLRRIGGLNDTIVTQLLEITTNSLQGLDLSDNHELTDLTLSSIRRYGSYHLRSLRLNGLRNLTAAGLEAAFMYIPPETNNHTDDSKERDDNDKITNPDVANDYSKPPPRLRSLDLGNCYHQAVTDEVLHQATLAATVIGTLSSSNAPSIENKDMTTNKNDSGTDVIPLRSSVGGLVSLNIQGSSLVTDVSMEQLVATCSNTLMELNVSFCPNITDQGLGYLVDNCTKQLQKVQIWGNAQITDEFLDGNLRVNDPDLIIVGGWIKKDTSRTIR